MSKKGIILAALLLISLYMTPLVGTVKGESNHPLGWEAPSPFIDLLTAYTAHVKPGDKLTLHLRSQLKVNDAYIFSVEQNGDKLVPVNETLKTSQSGDTVTLTIPADTPEGVYDLFVISDNGVYRIPQSIWVSNSCPTPVRIAHLTDQHFDLHPDYYISAVLLAKLLGVQLYIGTGDATDTASELQAKHYVMHRSMFLYGIPALENPGNHDHESDQTGTPFFKKYIAPEYWYRNYCNKILVVGLNTGKERNVITSEELAFLQNVLNKNKDVPIKIVGYHHPFFWHHGNLTSAYDDQRLLQYLSTSFWYGKNPQVSLDFLKTIEDYRVVLTLQGHVHSDSMVNFTSARTGYRTWFVTTTTTGGPHADQIYNGFQIIDVYPNDTVRFPFAPPTFKVPVTHTVKRTGGGYYPQLSIPVQDTWPRHFYADFYSPKGANTFALEVENTLGYLDVSNTTVIRVPWNSPSKPSFYLVNYDDKGTIRVLDELNPGDGYLYLLLGINAPNGTHVMLVGSTTTDETPPKASIKMTLPKKPRVGSSLTVYLDVSDSGWGIKSVKAYNPETGNSYNVKTSGKYYLVNLKVEKSDMKVGLEVTDLADHKVLYDLHITSSGVKLEQKQGAQEHMPIHIEVGEETTTTTSSHTTSTQPTGTTTTSHMTTTSTTTTTKTHTSSASTTATSSTTEHTESESAMSSIELIGAAVVVAIVIIGVALVMRR